MLEIGAFVKKIAITNYWHTHAMKPIFKKFALAALSAAALCASARAETVLRVGHFPNISHAQALVAHRLSMLGKGWFEERLGKGVKIQ